MNLEPWIDIRKLGADVANSAEENSLILSNAIASMKLHDFLLVPSGVFNIVDFTFDPPDDCGIICFGTLQSAYKGTVIRIGAESGKNCRMRYHIQSLKVISPSFNFSPNRVGIEIRNNYESYIDIRRAEGFETGIKILGSEGKGCCYNEIHLGRICNNKTNLKLTKETDGWCNENSYYGGRFSWNSRLPNYNGFKNIWISKHLDNNKFYGPNLEGVISEGQTAHGIYCEGRTNHFLFPRFEMRGRGLIEFTKDSADNTVFRGYGIHYGNKNIINRGKRNKIYKHGNWFDALFRWLKN